MTKIDQVRAEMIQAMKDKNKVRKDALSALLSALKAKFIDKKADLTEEEENAIVQREIKQLKETLETLPETRAEDIAECKGRIEVLTEFAPQMMDEAGILAAIASVLAELNIEQPEAKQKGLIMKNLMPKVKGKADGQLVNRLVGELF